MGKTILKTLSRFDRRFFDGKESFTYIGSGEIGGKAHGLADMKETLGAYFPPRGSSDIIVNIPTLTVITTEYYDLFLEQNDLHEIARSDNRDDIIAHAFQEADLPAQLVGDLRALISRVHTPLAVRSSSMLEDAMFEPFASVYATKMIPNRQADTDARFRELVEAVKFVYSSTFFGDAKNYIRATHHTTADEKMAVIIQEVVGERRYDRFYPTISGVARSYNYYAVGNAKPEEGVVDLALGLGRIIVDEGIAWSYSPAHPRSDPPYNAISDLLKQTQTEFWAINMGKPPAYDPINETEYMGKYDLKAADYDGVLTYIASTYIPYDDRINVGTSDDGARVINFAPLLKADHLPLNDLLKKLIKVCEDALGVMVEIEFAVTLDRKNCAPARFGFLQVRPMVVSDAKVEVTAEDMEADDLLLACENVIGNGKLDTIRDIIYVKPGSFKKNKTQVIAQHIEVVNRELTEAERRYLLIGFGRWGTSDTTAGIPVNFGQISGAKVIIEATLPEMNAPISQGSHFFHNLTSFKVLYFSVYHWADNQIDWVWLNDQQAAHETDYIKHVILPSPLTIKVDGRTGRGVIFHG
jgi:hypothetical protein